MSDSAANPPGLPYEGPTDAQIDAAMAADRAELRRLRRSIRKAGRAGRPFDRNLRGLERLLTESAALRERRLLARPEPRFDADLPILAHREAIVAAIAEHPVVIVCGETGSGKSTQLPKLCLAAGRGVDGVIGHTQPRRIAARSVAARVAEELGTPLGESVGYKVRFSDHTAPTTHIKLLTDGVLLAEAQDDALLSRYDTLILDEAHERSLNIDFLLGLLKRLVERRPELRLIVTSATIDAERFAEHFARGERPAPVIESSGRGYPVEVRYRPPDGDAADGFGAVCRDVVDAAIEVGGETSGDTLVFLPTERHIREAARLLRGVAPGLEVLPLYARLSSAEQQRVFRPGGKRRVVLATNVAESSVTVPNVTAVVDTGTARIARYAARSRVQRLPIEAISRASADQRAGRCGRVAPGVCVRLYSEDDYLARAEFPTAEVRRTNLAAVILRMKSLGLGEIEGFPLIDRPRPEAVREGRATLRELQATGEDGELTELGKRLGRMPVDPRVGRMILAAAEEGCLAEVLVIAAALETQDPRERPAEKQEAADAAHARFADGRSDFLAYLKLWDHLRRQREELSRSAFRRGIAKQFLSYTRVMEWEDVHRQLLRVCRENGLRTGGRKDSYGAIHRALLTGLLTSIATLRDVKPGGPAAGGQGEPRRERVEYQTPGGAGFALWPGAGPAVSKPKWVVAAEVVETSRRYLRTVARIRPEWLPRLAAHLIRREHNGPHWSRKRQTVVAHEKTSLGGLVLPGRSLVPYGPIDPAVSRELFIREALVEGGLDGEWDFLTHNAEVIGRVRDVGAKTRRADLLEGAPLLQEHYDQLLPPDVWDSRTFRPWRARACSKNPRLLHLDESALLPAEATRDAAAFPDQMACGGQTLPLTYQLDGASEADGVTVEVPAELLGLLDPDALDWGVPGLLREKLVALIRLLPKPIRTRLVPAPDTAERVAESLPFGEGRFAATVARAFSREAGEPVPTSALRVDELPAHLRMNVRVVDAEGALLGEGRDVAALRAGFAASESSTEERTLPDPRWTIDGLTEWSFGELPAAVEVEHAGRRVVGRPGLVDRDDSVDVRLFVVAADAERSTRAGLRRLFLLADADTVRAQVKWLPDWDRLKTVLRRLDPSRDAAAEVAELIADRAIGEPDTWPTNADSFARWRKTTRGRVPPETHEATPVVVGTLQRLDGSLDYLKRVERDFRHPATDDVRSQIAALTRPGFLASTPPDWATELPRYLEAIETRLRRIAEGGGAQDLRMRADVEPRAERYWEAVAEDPRLAADERGVRYRWMLEEFRVSTFAQRLGTRVKASAKRLDEAWDALMLG